MRWGAASILIAFAVLIGSAGGDAMGRSVEPVSGSPGGAPSIPLGPPDEGKRISPSLVIGNGMSYAGPAEIVAYGWEAPDDAQPSAPGQFCAWIEYPRINDVSFGACDLPLTAYGKPISIDSRGQGFGSKRYRFTEIAGRLRPQVAAVRVSFWRGKGNRAQVMAIVGQASGALQERLNMPRPFGFFAARVRGLVPLHGFRVEALNAHRRVIGVIAGH